MRQRRFFYWILASFMAEESEREPLPDGDRFLSANAWDVAGAASFGLRTVWINRFGQHAERLGCAPDAELTSLAELPALLLGGETAPPRR